ncbi:MAG: IS1595 family transposase [Gammaproteobacteria bacterium]|nr:IS1595 family transposase [Gammaproteobacteria bacterium]
MTSRRKASTLSLFDLQRMFPTEESIIEYMEQIRWGDNLHCVKCGATDRITKQKQRKKGYWCGDCRSYFNAYTGTPLEHNRIRDQRTWIYASYLLMTARKGISALQLRRELNISYKAAWYMLHRLRIACGGNMKVLKGEVELDESYLGGKEANKHESGKLRQGRGAVGKTTVLGMRERGGDVKAMVIDKPSQNEIHPKVHENIEYGSTLYTDEHKGYDGLDRVFYSQGRVNHSVKEFVNQMAHTNSIESVWAVIKRGYNGTYHNWSVKHCQAYINEFSFRLNQGNVKRDTKNRLDSLFRGMLGKKVTYAALTS